MDRGFNDIVQILDAGTPLQYESSGAITAASGVITTCPNGVWRIVITATAYWTASANQVFIQLCVRRGGVDFCIATSVFVNAGTYKNNVSYNDTLPLIPGDQLIWRDQFGALETVKGDVAYFDIPMDAPIYKKGRRG